MREPHDRGHVFINILAHGYLRVDRDRVRQALAREPAASPNLSPRFSIRGHPRYGALRQELWSLPEDEVRQSRQAQGELEGNAHVR